MLLFVRSPIPEPARRCVLDRPHPDPLPEGEGEFMHRYPADAGQLCYSIARSSRSAAADAGRVPAATAARMSGSAARTAG